MESVCLICDKSFSSNSNLRIHLKRVHKILDKTEISALVPVPLTNRKSIECVICKIMVLNSFSSLREHFSTHDISLTQEELYFESMDAFNQWKDEVERKCCSQYFISKSATQERVSKTYFKCCRSGSYVPKEMRVRHLKTQGSRKINGQCPSTITLVCEDETHFKCYFVPTHVGHSMNVEHLNLQKKCRTEIAVNLAQNIPEGNILDSFRDNASLEEISRETLLTKKDIRNIRQAYNINNDGIRHPNDTVSVDSFVIQDRESVAPCVLFHKRECEESEMYPSLKNEDFILIFMNSGQREMLLKYGTDVICMDSTHGLKNKYLLTSILILDDTRQGFPCAFMISSKTDTETMVAFVNEIHKAVGIISANIFMSDMDPTLFNAWKRVMGPVESQLFCTWHVLRAWDRNIRKKIAAPDVQRKCMAELQALMTETDEQAFNRMLDAFIHNADESMTHFIAYFIDQYVPVKSMWAHCFRLHCGINTNMHLERMHKTIKYCYLNGLKNLRLDKTIHLLMKFLRDRFFDRLITLHKGKVTRKIADLRQRHKRCLEISDRIVLEVTENSWQVQASDVLAGMYLVETSQATCTCSLKCEYCEACIHNYVCECRDSSIKWNMCKHIHLVCQYLKKKESATLESAGSLNRQEAEEEDLVISEDARASERVAVTDGIQAIDGEVASSISTIREDVTRQLSMLIDIAQSATDVRKLQALKKILAPSFSVLAALDQQNSTETSTGHAPWNTRIEKQRRIRKRRHSSINEGISSASNDLLFRNVESGNDQE